MRSLSGRVRFICTPREEVTRGRRYVDYGDRAGSCCLHATNFACAQRRHALPGVVNLLPAVQANLVSLLFERERPRLAPVAAAKNNVIEKTKQALNPIHKINPP